MLFPDGQTWLYRGVPEESSEVEDVAACNEVRPPRPDLVGEYYRDEHLQGYTETGYTSWTTDRSVAEAAAEACSEEEDLSGRIRIFRVRIVTLDLARVFPGRDDEEEYLIEGTVEEVAFSDGVTDEDD